MRLSEKQIIHAVNISILILWGNAKGINITKGEAYRPAQMQRWYFLHGLSETLFGKHGKRLADDLHIFVDGKYIDPFINPEYHIILGEQWKRIDARNRWGGNFIVKGEPDYGHFEFNG